MDTPWVCEGVAMVSSTAWNRARPSNSTWRKKTFPLEMSPPDTDQPQRGDEGGWKATPPEAYEIAHHTDAEAGGENPGHACGVCAPVRGLKVVGALYAYCEC